jgi:hypothetical protein
LVDRGTGLPSLHVSASARTCEMLQVSWHVSDAEACTSGVHVGGAKWRREVPPPRRLTARELTLPWACFSVAVRWRRVNQVIFAGTLAVAGACLKIANAGSCRPGPKLVIAALLVEKPPVAGGPGTPVKLIEPPPKARNAAENRPDAIASGSGSDQLLPSRRPQQLPSSPSCRRSKPRPRPIRYRLSPQAPRA